MINRREMLALSTATVAALAGTRTRRVYGYPANETITIGTIGTGGRCRSLMRTMQNVPNVRYAGVCDVWDPQLERGLEMAAPGAVATKDYNELLARDDIDAVLIATPDHLHVPITIAACQAGKDVYVEKPLTHKLVEGQAVIDAQNRTKRIVLVGQQQRSMPHIQKARELVRAGRLGKINKARLSWNRNFGDYRPATPDIDPKTVDWKAFLGGHAPDQPFHAFRFRNWRWIWDFGGGILSDLMVHWIDMVNWMLDLEHPTEAVTVGHNFLRTQGYWETPDTTQTLLSYPDHDLQVHFEGTFANARAGAMCELMGRDATLYFDRGRYEIHPERGKGEYEELVLGQGRRGRDFYENPDGDLLHLEHWVHCMRTREKPNTPAEAGVTAVTSAHLANRALRTGQVARWPEA